MLTIRSQQMEALESYQQLQFRKMLCEHIQQEYPVYGKVSSSTLMKLIGFGLTRARNYGFSLQSSLGQFIYLMAAIAPNFDLHPAINAFLVNNKIPADNRLEVSLENLPDGVWDEAIQQSSHIGWFLIDNMSSQPPIVRIVSALNLALRTDKTTDNEVRSITSVDNAIATALSHGWKSEDAQFVFAAAWVMYGDNFSTSGATKYPWIKNVFDSKSAIKIQVALLRIRMALDFQIWL
ncbi:MAG TPA: hypothetical protein PKD35_08900 [Nitrosomonas sp.]|nr:hypothetical protein [Nitrosomonas sp.]